ncbi:GNAT family N-acetyltransferase [Halobacterium litoreum]|uniref:GNAT family N-acetyltransferase n=1 Tax=Halobacterium litoreum TaxID=2039234 RepID=UPI001E3F900C|nr:GNAT family N-acetyltransferase [Halobacterium litoreum]UHH13566.1 GNAT family N-acetyltransferase [Halobacterium litoreum]
MRLREATPDDATAVRRVADAAWHDAHADIVGADAVEEFLATYYDPEDLRERFGTGDSVTFVAEDDDVVAYASGVPSDDGYTLGSLYVHPDRQGEGVGSRLLARVEDAARDAGYDALDLVVMAENDDTIAFYEAKGYERAGDHHDELLDVDGYVYEKPL